MRAILVISIFLLYLIGSPSAVHSDEIEGLEFQIKPYIGLEESFYKTSDYNFYVGKGQKFFLYLIVENKNDYEIQLDSLKIESKITGDNPITNSITLAEGITLGKKGIDIATREFEITGEAFKYRDRNRDTWNILYSKPKGLIVVDESKKVVFELFIKYKSDDEVYTSELGVFSIEVVPINQLENYKKEGKAENLSKLFPLISGLLAFLFGVYNFKGLKKPVGKKQKKKYKIKLAFTIISGAILIISIMLFLKSEILL